jgi:hypothetical protein
MAPPTAAIVKRVLSFATGGYLVAGIQHIIGMPPHIIMTGIPIDMHLVMLSQHSFIISMVIPSIGIILHIMPSLVISMVMRHIIGAPIIGIGIGMGIIIGTGIIIIGIMPGIDEPIIDGIMEGIVIPIIC